MATGSAGSAGNTIGVTRFDAIVIGSGQAGTPLASAIAQSGRHTALIEATHIGGCCINEGCTPTKTMIASGRVAHLARRAKDYGIWTVPSSKPARDNSVSSSPDEGGWEEINVAVDMLRVRQRRREITESFRSGSEARLKGRENLEVIIGEAAFKDPHKLRIKLADGVDVDVEGDMIFINTGERPYRPNISGMDTLEPTRVLDSTSIMDLAEVPPHLIVLGGGYIGLEFGQLFRRLGSRVTVLQRNKQLVPREDPEIADAAREVLRREGIEVLLNSTTTKVEAGDASTSQDNILVYHEDPKGKSVAIGGSHLLLAAGRIPNTDMLNLSAAGVEVDRTGHIIVDGKLQTNVPHIYALGDVHGGPAFTHISYDDFRVIRSNLLTPDHEKAATRSTADRIVPYVMFTDPQLGHVGLHEREARKQYGDLAIQTATMPMGYVARALETDESQGLMKAVVHVETGQILGFSCLGIEGGEIMSIVQTAMLGKLHYSVLQNAVFAHPTLAESLNNLWGFLK